MKTDKKTYSTGSCNEEREARTTTPPASYARSSSFAAKDFADIIDTEREFDFSLQPPPV